MLAEQSLVAIAVKGEDGSSSLAKVESAQVDAFTGAVISGLFDSSIARHHDFALGYAAALDAFCAGKIDLADPIGAIEAACRDVYGVGCGEPTQTDVMRVYFDGANGGAR